MAAEPLEPEEEAAVRWMIERWPDVPRTRDRQYIVRLLATLDAARRASDAQVARQCEAGCGCRYGTDDPDARDCACDGPCTMADPEVWFATPAPQPATPPLDVERLALAIHGSNEHSNRPGCLDMDRDSAQLLAGEYDRLVEYDADGPQPDWCPTCNRVTFRDQFDGRRQPRRCSGCQLVVGRCRCAPERVEPLPPARPDPSKSEEGSFLPRLRGARLAAPVPQPATPPLDVERLERAFVHVIDRRPKRVEVTYFMGDDIPVEHQREAFLRDIAVEYARLAGPRATPETLPPANPALMGTIQRGRKDRPPEAER